MADTALREVEEEIGVLKKNIFLLGKLTELYIPVSNFMVYPFVGYIEDEINFSLQISEVKGVLTPSIEYFNNPEIKKVTEITFQNGNTVRNVPYFDVEGRVVWGATAMILSEFLEILPSK